MDDVDLLQMYGQDCRLLYLRHTLSASSFVQVAASGCNRHYSYGALPRSLFQRVKRLHTVRYHMGAKSGTQY
eukprot:scaffold3705_cov159-Skeletonema_marinoi.AAC.4